MGVTQVVPNIGGERFLDVSILARLASDLDEKPMKGKLYTGVNRSVITERAVENRWGMGKVDSEKW
jgi:hypothetical protein